MNSLEKWMILTHLQKMPNNVGDLGKIIVAISFEWLPKVQKNSKSGHTGTECDKMTRLFFNIFPFSKMKFYPRT